RAPRSARANDTSGPSNDVCPASFGTTTVRRSEVVMTRFPRASIAAAWYVSPRLALAERVWAPAIETQHNSASISGVSVDFRWRIQIGVHHAARRLAAGE